MRAVSLNNSSVRRSTAAMRRDVEPSASASADATDVVLEATPRACAELERPRFGLSSNQRRLLARLDGKLSLRECAAAEAKLQSDRLPRDAARLVAFGLARQVRGELPNELLVSAMNLTARISLEDLKPLEPERTVMPMVPRVAPSPNGRAQLSEYSSSQPPRERGRWSVALLIALLGAAIAAIAYLR